MHVKIGVFQRGFDVGYREGFVFSFVFGFLVRLVPEVLSFPYPIGFDTVYYAARMNSGDENNENENSYEDKLGQIGLVVDY